MKIGKMLSVFLLAAALLSVAPLTARAQPRNDAAQIAIGAKEIGGVVTSPHGREAGMWVIAETTEVPSSAGSIRKIAFHFQFRPNPLAD